MVPVRCEKETHSLYSFVCGLSLLPILKPTLVVFCRVFISQLPVGILDEPVYDNIYRRTAGLEMASFNLVL